MTLVSATLGVAATTATLLLAACSSDTPSTQRDAYASAMGHIHGIGVDPADGTLYAATHYGLFRIADGQAERVADRWQDTMAFTVIGNRHFLGSGHPALTEDLPVHLGLIESTDAGETWHPLALQGEADFHALEPSRTRLYAYDALTRSLMISRDHETFQAIIKLNATDLAADPSDPNRIIATHPRTGLVMIDSTTARTLPMEAPKLAFVDWPEPHLLVGLGPTGDIQVSTDAGTTWSIAGVLPGTSAALEVTDPTWYAATTEGLFESSDKGTTWTQVDTER